MNPRTTGLLILVAAALGAFVYLYEVRGGAQRDEAARAAKHLFPGVKTSDVSWISLTTTDGKPARVERHDGAWQLVEPLHFPGDAVNLDGIAAGVAELTSEMEIKDPQAPEIYGIDGTSHSVRFGADGKEYELRIGKKSPVGSNTYVASAAEPHRIFTVSTYRTANLERSADDLRDRRVVRFDRASIVAIDARWPGGFVRLQRGDDGWKLVEPISGPADETTVDTLLSNLSYLRADSFNDAPGPDAKTGLDKPAFDVTLSAKPPAEGGEPPRFHLTLGKDENGKRLARGDEPSLYVVAAPRLDDYPRSLAAYRFKELTRYVATDAKSVELVFESPGQSKVTERFEQGDAGWQGSPELVDPGKMARLVAELARLKGSDVLLDAAKDGDLAKLGLAPPRVTIRVFGAAAGGAAAPELGVLEIGSDPDGKGAAARTPSVALVYRLAPGVSEWLPTSLESFRKDFVLKPGEAPKSDAEATPLPPELEPGSDTAQPHP
jgi:hypothetical protein